MFKTILLAVALACAFFFLGGCGGGGGGGGNVAAPVKPPPVELPPLWTVPDPINAEARAEQAWCGAVLLSVSNSWDRQSTWHFEPAAKLLERSDYAMRATARELWFSDRLFMQRERDACFELIGFVPSWTNTRIIAANRPHSGWADGKPAWLESGLVYGPAH